MRCHLVFEWILALEHAGVNTEVRCVIINQLDKRAPKRVYETLLYLDVVPIDTEEWTLDYKIA